VGDAALWDAMNEVKDRLARLEEQSKHRGDQVDKIDKNVEELRTLAIEARTAGRIASLFGRWGYGIIGALGAFVVAKWSLVVKVFS